MDPNPIKHIGSLLKSVRERLEPLLSAAGYSFVERNQPQHPGVPRWLDYERGDRVLSIRYESHAARLVGEVLSGDDVQSHIVTDMNQPRSADQLEERVRVFVAEFGAIVARP